MDASAYIETDKWERMKTSNGWNEIEMRDNRYNQIVHMVSAANGAEEFYSTEVERRFSQFSIKFHYRFSRNTLVARKALIMLATWITRQLLPGSAIPTSTSSTTRRISRRKSTAWSSVCVRSWASTPATACCAHLASSSSSFRARCATISFHHSRTSTLSITICSRAVNVLRLAWENVVRMDTGGNN